MSERRHIGKVILQLRPEEGGDLRVPAAPRCYPAPQRVQVITGGFGGFGLELAGQCGGTEGRAKLGAAD